MDDELARSLREMWQARLQQSFPGRRFTVEFSPADPSTGEEVGLLFYERR
jgi:hypothetical protein